MASTIVVFSLSLLLLQGALSSTADSQCPAGDLSCSSSPDVSEFLQSRVKVSQFSDSALDDLLEEEEEEHVEKGNLSIQGLWFSVPPIPSFPPLPPVPPISIPPVPPVPSLSEVVEDLGDAVESGVDSVGNAVESGVDAFNEAKDSVESTINDAVDGIGEVILDAGEFIDDAVTAVVETVHTVATTVGNAVTDFVEKVSEWGEAAWEATKEAYEAAKKEAMEFANSLTSFGDCLNIGKLFKKIMLGGAAALIDLEASTFNMELSATPKLDTKLKTNLGENDGMMWGMGPEQHGYVTVTAGANMSFNPEVSLTVSTAPATVTVKISGKMHATILAELTATAPSNFEKKVKFSPQSVLGCAGVFCVNIMVEGIAYLLARAEHPGHASAEMEAEYEVSVSVEFDVATGKAKEQLEAGKLTKQASVNYESLFQGRIELKVGPLITILPIPGVPISFEPWINMELKAYSQANGGLPYGNQPQCNEKCSEIGCVDYRGCQTQARTGDTCQKWTSQTPHAHTRTASNFPNKGLGDHDFCRNPYGEDSIWCYTTNPNKRWSYCDPVCPHGEQLNGADGAAYRGCQTKTRNGRTCQKWTSQSPHQHTTTVARFPGKHLGDHNFCRNPNGKATIWCYTNQSDKTWEFCNPIPTSLLEQNATDSEDATAFWQSKVKVAQENAAHLMLRQTSDGGSTPINNACGKAGVNIHAGFEINFLGFPIPDFNPAELLVKIAEELVLMPVRAAAAALEMVNDCLNIPGLDGALSLLDSVTKKAAEAIGDAVPDLDIDFPEPKLLYKTDAVCQNIWQDSLPQGQNCSNYNVGC